MKSNDLVKSYLQKANKRMKILELLKNEEAYSDVVREAQEIVELVQKAILRKIGIDPPKWHDVSDIIRENIEIIPEIHHQKIFELIPVAKWLRSERELSFYGDVDFIPTEEYTIEDAEKAIDGAAQWLELANKICVGSTQ